MNDIPSRDSWLLSVLVRYPIDWLRTEGKLDWYLEQLSTDFTRRVGDCLVDGSGESRDVIETAQALCDWAERNGAAPKKITWTIRTKRDNES